MRKFVSLVLALVMVCSLSVCAFATQDYSLGTAVSVVGENSGYTVTVPATMQAGQTGTVTASGAWHSKQVLKVSTPEVVEVSYNGQSIDVGITFDTIEQRGSDISAFNIVRDITLEDVSTTFGTWTGIIEYTVEMTELISFSVVVDGETTVYYAEQGMTYGTWLDSEYNTDDFADSNGLLNITYNGENHKTVSVQGEISGQYRKGIDVQLKATDDEKVEGTYGLTVDSIYISDGKVITV